MSDTQTPLDNPATDSVASGTVAPPNQAGEQPGSTPAPVDTTASEGNAEDKDTSERQNRRDSRAFATLRRENRDLNRALGRLQAMVEAKVSQPAQPTEPDQQPQARPQAAPPSPDYETARMVLERLEDAGQDIEGFDDVMETITEPSFPMSATARDYLAISEHPAQMAQWMAKNKSEVARISRLEPAVAVKALEKAEARLSAKPAPKITKAPPPPTTVGGSSTASFDPAKASMDDYAKWRMRQT